MLKTFSLTTLALLCMALSNGSQTTEPYRQILTSVERNVHLDNWQITDRDLKLGGEANWSVRKYTLHGGKQEGVDIIVVDNGRLTLTVIPTRGMSLLKVVSGDVTLGWNSPVKEVVHPKFINLQSRGGLGWLEGFNEFMVRCGMEWAGHPGRDEFINNTGDRAEMELTLHGRIGNIPASEVEVVIDRQPPYRIRLRGRVDERMFYGPKLELWTEVSTEPGSNTFRIEDKLTNHGAYEQEYQIIYHANYGPPLLEKSSRLVAAVKEARPFNAHAARGLSEYGEYAAPTKGFIEQVYGLALFADQQQHTTVMLRNAAGDKAVTMTWNVAQLPYLTLWKNTNAVEEGYVTGLEPGSGFPANRSIERKAGRVPKLGPGETRSFALDVGIQKGLADVDRAAKAITKLQAGRQTQINSQPIKAK
jgi:Domain of unknown function (DUF4432)